MFRKKDRGDVLFECPIFVCLSLRLTWAEYRVVATTRQPVASGVYQPFCYFCLSLFTFRQRAAETCNKKMRENKKQAKNIMRLETKKQVRWKGAVIKLAKGLSRLERCQAEETEGSLMMRMMKLSMMSMTLWWGYLWTEATCLQLCTCVKFLPKTKPNNRLLIIFFMEDQ